MLEVLGLIVDIVVGAATIGSLWYLGKQVKLERAADERNARDQAKAEEERINDQIRLLCVNWCSLKKRNGPLAPGEIEALGVRVTNYSNTVFRDFELTLGYDNGLTESSKKSSASGAYYKIVSADKRDEALMEEQTKSGRKNVAAIPLSDTRWAIPVSDKSEAALREGQFKNVFEIKFKARTPFLRPGDFFVNTKRGNIKTEEDGTLKIHTEEYSPLHEFLDISQIEQGGFTIGTVGTTGNEHEGCQTGKKSYDDKYKFIATCYDIRGRKWKMTNETHEWQEDRQTAGNSK